MQQEDRQAALMLSLVSVKGQMQITKLIVPISFSIFKVRSTSKEMMSSVDCHGRMFAVPRDRAAMVQRNQSPPN
jgi:hypothetical protein